MLFPNTSSNIHQTNIAKKVGDSNIGDSQFLFSGQTFASASSLHHATPFQPKVDQVTILAPHEIVLKAFDSKKKSILKRWMDFDKMIHE